ncbi:unnamed protein product [Periconia digitata]|uniref:Uncharacterized protein n=1 Tax=Periconia digitata TaxID=1303443 RepID=A0A9W4UAY2_9PLEO|nr:unnamed protein product [Periconia digitata]
MCSPSCRFFLRARFFHTGRRQQRSKLCRDVFGASMESAAKQLRGLGKHHSFRYVDSINPIQ